MTTIDKFLDKFFEFFLGSSDEEIKTINLDAKEFFEKLKGYKVSLTIVMDPYGVAFGPDYRLLWFFDGGEKIFYLTYLPIDHELWQIIQNNVEIFFPNEEGWRQTVPYEKIKNILNST